MAVQSRIIGALTDSAAAGSGWSGPLVSGPRSGANVLNQGANQGLAVLRQDLVLNQNGTNAVSGTLWLPRHSVITNLTVMSPVAWNSAVSAVLSVGTSPGDTTYLGGVSLLAAAGFFQEAPFSVTSPTAAQIQAWLDTGSNEAMVATVTPSGATTLGQTVLSVTYAQTINWQNP